MAVDKRRYSVRRLSGGLKDLVASSPALLPGLLAAGTFVALGASEAGFDASSWYAAALFLLALLCASLIALGIPRALPRPVLAALVLLGLYVAWTYLSITWASQQGPAWDGANRTALYFVVFALFALWRFDARGAFIVLAVLGLGIAGLGLVELLKMNWSSDPHDYFIDARFAEPAGYMNANVALWTLGLLPCLFLASRRAAPVALRGLALGGAGLLAGLALLGQSRGWVLALPAALAIFVLVCPGRLRLLAVTLAAAVGGLAASGPVLAVHDNYSAERLDALVSDATGAILGVAGVLVVLGLVGAVIDRRLNPRPATTRRIGLVAAALAAFAVVGGLAAYTAAEGSPTGKLADAWHDFKEGGGGPEAGASRFASGDTERWDFWTVAWNAFEDEPLRGIGVENFQEEYLRFGTSREQPRYAHSLELGVLSQTGVIGALFLFGGLGAALLGALRARRAPAPERAVAAAAAALFVYWLAHGSVDWFWEFPGITAPAIAALGITCALAPRPSEGTAPVRRAVVLVPATLTVLALALSFALPWLAELEVQRASRAWSGNPEAAFHRLDRAASLNPLAARPNLTAATIALRLDRVELAKREFHAALEREPRNVYALLELGVIAAGRGEREAGLALVQRAAALTPNDEIVANVVARLRRGESVDLDALNRQIRDYAYQRGTGTK